MDTARDKAEAALLLVQAELKKSGNWTKTDFGWPKVREAICEALNAIKEEREGSHG